MHVVVTGATGNVGTALLRALGQDPAVDSVLGLARRLPDLQLPKVTWAAADVFADPLEEHIAGADAVVHLAWLFQPTHRPDITWDANVLGTQRVLDAVAQVGARALVVASSVGAYSPRHDDVPVDESWPTHGGGPAAYAREKAYVERLLDGFERSTPSCRVVRMRPSFIFQETSATEQRRLFGGPLVPGALIRKGLLPAVPWPRGLRFQALHADDAAAAYRLALVKDVSGAFNLAADPVIDAKEAGDLLDARTVEVPPRLVRRGLALAWGAHLVPAAPALYDVVMQLPLMDSSRARDEMGWTPHATSRDALEELLRGLQRGSDDDTPPLARETSGPLRSHEAGTGVGARP
jgi:nucleoside-diphosphate-sugar epimerase